MKWLQRIDLDEPGPATDEEIAAVEKTFGVKLPQDFVDVIRDHHGAMPLPHGFDVPANGHGSGVEYFYHFRGTKPVSLQHISVNFAEGLPPGAVPIAAALGGDVVYFDYRHTPQNPSVWVLMHDVKGPPRAKLADSFTGFLEMLIED